jgi:hypothetical protein
VTGQWLPYRVRRPTGNRAHRARTTRYPELLMTACGQLMQAHKAREATPSIPACKLPGCDPTQPRIRRTTEESP